jgi:hypothetical protein
MIPRSARGNCRASKAENPAVGEGGFDTRHRCRATSPDVAAPTSRCRTLRLASTGRREAEDIRRRRHHGRDEFPQRRLQEGYDAECVAVACPGKDRVFTRGRPGWGHKNTTPPTRKTAPTGVAVAMAFARGAPSTYVEPRCWTVACRHRRRHCQPTEASPEGPRRAGCSQQPHSCVGRHPLRSGYMQTWTYPATRVTLPHAEAVVGTSAHRRRCRRHRMDGSSCSRGMAGSGGRGAGAALPPRPCRRTGPSRSHAAIDPRWGAPSSVPASSIDRQAQPCADPPGRPPDPLKEAPDPAQRCPTAAGPRRHRRSIGRLAPAGRLRRPGLRNNGSAHGDGKSGRRSTGAASTTPGMGNTTAARTTARVARTKSALPPPSSRACASRHPLRRRQGERERREDARRRRGKEPPCRLRERRGGMLVGYPFAAPKFRFKYHIFVCNLNQLKL